MPPRRPFDAYTNPLHELVDVTMAAKTMTALDVANRSGGKLAQETVAVIRRGDRPLRTPLRQATMEGLAKGLGLPFHTVQDAVYASLPKPPKPELDRDTQTVVDLMLAAPTATRRRLRRLIEAELA